MDGWVGVKFRFRGAFHFDTAVWLKQTEGGERGARGILIIMAVSRHHQKRHCAHVTWEETSTSWVWHDGKGWFDPPSSATRGIEVGSSGSLAGCGEGL